MTFSPEDRKRMYWHSRRGMLELDLLLVPFASDCLATMSDTQLEKYRELLAQEDQDLFSWLIKRFDAPTPVLSEMVELILGHNAANVARGV